MKMKQFEYDAIKQRQEIREKRLHDEIDALRTEVNDLRVENAEIKLQLSRITTENKRLTNQISVMTNYTDLHDVESKLSSNYRKRPFLIRLFSRIKLK
jgi:septal ring factor EnvC (AmiA/AmiB activator)